MARKVKQEFIGKYAEQGGRKLVLFEEEDDEGDEDADEEEDYGDEEAEFEEEDIVNKLAKLKI